MSDVLQNVKYLADESAGFGMEITARRRGARMRQRGLNQMNMGSMVECMGRTGLLKLVQATAGDTWRNYADQHAG